VIDIDLKDGKEHIVSLYCLDWDRKGRWLVVDAIDARTEIAGLAQPDRVEQGR